MQQKKTWRPYLLIGISLLIINLSGCQKLVEYRLDTEFVFVNESNRTITFTIFDHTKLDIRAELILDPNEKHSFLHRASGGYDNPNPNSCCYELLHSVLDGADRGDIIVEFDNKSCRVQEPAIISNYTNEVLGERLFRYTFVFTDEVLDNPLECL